MKVSMNPKTLFAALVTAAGAMAVLLSLVSIEDARFTGEPPAHTPISQEISSGGEGQSDRPILSSQSPLPDEYIQTAAGPAAPTPAPMDRSAYRDGDLWIRIPALGVEAAVIDGTDLSSLKKGPGLYEISPMPDQEDGNVCIAGHRTTYGAWFRHVDTLTEGDQIILFCAYGEFTYEVEKVWVVDQYDWSVTEPTGYTALTLTACHPPGSARQRIVVRARRVRY